MPYVIASPVHRHHRPVCVEECPVDCIYDGDAQALHQPQGVHRLRRLRAGLPGRGHLPGPAGARRGQAVRRGQPAFFTEVLPGRDAPLGAPGGAHKTGEIGVDTALVVDRAGSAADARRPRPRSTPTSTCRCWASSRRPGSQWARDFGPDGVVERGLGRRRPAPAAALDALFAAAGCRRRRCCSASTARRPPATRRFDDLLPIVEAQPAPVPAGGQRQPAPALPDRPRAAPSARPRRGRRSSCTRSTAASGCDDAALYPAYSRAGGARRPARRALRDAARFPGSMNELADPAHLLPGDAGLPRPRRRARPRRPRLVVRRRGLPGALPPDGVDRAVRAAAQAAARRTTRGYDLARLARRGSSAPTGPACPGSPRTPGRSPGWASTRRPPRWCSAATRCASTRPRPGPRSGGQAPDRQEAV